MKDILDSTVETTVKSGPEVSQDAVNAERQDEEMRQKSYENLVDKEGGIFDPEIHVTNKEGEPVLTTGGKLRRKPGVKKNSSKIGSVNQSNISGQNTDQNTRLIAYQLVDAITGIARMTLGEEWNPINDPQTGVNEREVMGEAWGAYLESKQISDIPPGVAVLLAMGQYSIMRIGKPQTKTKIGQSFLWVKSKWKGLFKNAQSDNGDNGERKDNTGETPVQENQKSGDGDSSS